MAWLGSAPVSSAQLSSAPLRSAHLYKVQLERCENREHVADESERNSTAELEDASEVGDSKGEEDAGGAECQGVHLHEAMPPPYRFDCSGGILFS
mmetsp:Transcript_16763/g.63759  ORF Transcript_16763/g.63759 Transcript_16763/m.63759 type:complete len:95 (-) Transcript_16763:1824-2108(-)